MFVLAPLVALAACPTAAAAAGGPYPASAELMAA